MLRNVIFFFLIAFMWCTNLAFAEPVYRGRLTERWSIDGDSEDLLVGTIVDAKSDQSGVTYLLDYTLQHVLAIGTDGGLLLLIGGEGDGPGETRHAGRLFLVENKKIGLLDLLSSKISWLDLDGNPLPSTNIRLNSDGSGVFGTWDTRIVGDGYVAAFWQRNTTGQEGRFQITLAYVPDDGKEPVILLQMPDKTAASRGPVENEADEYNFVWNSWDVNRKGDVFAALSRDSDDISVFSLSGEKVRTFSTGVERRPRTKEEIEKVSKHFVKIGNQEGAVKIAQFDPYFDHVWCDEEGNVWTNTPSRKEDNADDVFLRYEVFSPEGKLIYGVELEGPWARIYDHSFLLNSRSMIIVENGGGGRSDLESDEHSLSVDDKPRIACYDFELVEELGEGLKQ